ncbi:hypothetical protein M9458_055789 [Cirrhinus mrigala]|uniref:Gypsy retrotransposon integrase-like protein 1 n=1 Tax=Cirrhinus mrigala TaxID=683832 RepID=A0ABD0MFE9_CIRMR
MIRDQLIEHTNDAKVRETLLLEPDDLSLSPAITIAVRIESAAACVSALTKQQTIADCPAPSPMPPSTLQPSQNDTLAAADSSTIMLLRRQQWLRPRPQAQTPRPCDNCGSSSHLSRAQNCPARGQTCCNCVCRSAPAVSIQAPTIIYNVYSGPVSFKACSVRLNGVCIALLLDTGASVSLLNMHTYNTFFSALPLSAPAASLCGYSDSKIDLVGSLRVTVGYGNKMVPSFTFNVACHGANLMGLDLFSALGFSLMDTKGAVILTVSTPWQQKWLSLFEGLGCLTAFAHQPLLNPTIKPVIQPLRRIPLALRDSVSAELKQLLDIGIIEPVDTSPWSGALRVCVDLRAVNKAVILDRFPLPTSEELIAQFHGSAVFSKLDLRQGYLQVPLDPSSRNLTAFVTHAGVFRYTCMPFGLSSAPSCFQKIMVSVLAGIPGVAIYLDDVVIHGPTPKSHDERLSRVFAALAEHKLTLNAEKSIFSAPTIEYVGFQLSADGITPLRSNIDPILAIPEPSSAVQRWHLYLYGRAFTLRTDHQALTTLLSTSGTGHRPLRLHCWSNRLRQYNFDLKFTPGRDNVVADLLSRSAPPHPNTPIHTDTDQVERDIIQMLHAPLQAVISLQELKEASEQDPVLSQLRVYILNGWPQEVPEGLAAFSRIKQELSCWNDTCVARGLCTVFPNTLHARVLAMAHEGHLGIVKLKQRCRERVWWPRIDKDIEALVKDCAACLLSASRLAIAALGPPAAGHIWLSPALPQEPLQRVRTSVTRQQRRMKQKFDLSAQVKVPDIKAADWVRVRRPHRDNKLASYWSAPLQVTHQLGPATFLLSDGTRWHASRLRKVPPLAHTTVVTSQATPPARQDTPALQLTPQIAPAQAPDISTNLPAGICACPSQAAQPHPRVSPRPVRIRSRPGHLQDFVSTFHV